MKIGANEIASLTLAMTGGGCHYQLNREFRSSIYNKFLDCGSSPQWQCKVRGKGINPP